MLKVTTTSFCLIIASICLGIDRPLTDLDAKHRDSPLTTPIGNAQDIPDVSGNYQFGYVEVQVIQDGRRFRIVLPKDRDSGIERKDSKEFESYVSSGWVPGVEVCNGEIGQQQDFRSFKTAWPITGRCLVRYNRSLVGTVPQLPDVWVDLGNSFFFRDSVTMRVFLAAFQPPAVESTVEYQAYRRTTSYPEGLYIPGWGDERSSGLRVGSFVVRDAYRLEIMTLERLGMSLTWNDINLQTLEWSDWVNRIKVRAVYKGRSANSRQAALRIERKGKVVYQYRAEDVNLHYDGAIQDRRLFSGDLDLSIAKNPQPGSQPYKFQPGDVVVAELDGLSSRLVLTAPQTDVSNSPPASGTTPAETRTPTTLGKTEFYPQTPPKTSIAGITVLRREADFPFVRKAGDRRDTNRWLLFALLNNANQIGVNEITSRDPHVKYRIHGYGLKLEDFIASPDTHSPFFREGFNKALDGLGLEDVVRLGGITGVLIIAEAFPSDYVRHPEMPGTRTLIIDGAEGEWMLDPGTATGQIRIVRPVTTFETAYEELDETYIYDKVQVEIRAEQPSSLNQIGVTILRNRSILEFDGSGVVMARRVGSTNVYRTPPIYLETAGKQSLKRGDVYYQPFKAGDLFTAVPAARWFDPQIQTQLKVFESPVDPEVLSVTPDDNRRPSWENALIAAGRAAGKSTANLTTLPEEEAASFYNLFIFQLSGHRTTFKVKDHAATLVLRRQFLWMAENQIALLEAIREDSDALRAYAEHLRKVIEATRPADRPQAFELGPLSKKVRGMNQTGLFPNSPTLWRALDEYWKGEGRADYEERHIPDPKPEWLLKQMEASIDQQLKSINDARYRAKNAQDIKALLELTGDQFGKVLERAYPRLVTLTEKSTPQGIEKVWVPNEKARLAVSQVNAGLFELFRAKGAARADTDALFTIVGGFAGGAGKEVIFKAIALAAGGAGVIMTFEDVFIQGGQDLGFAYKAAPLIGWDRFHLGTAQRQPNWKVFGKLFLSVAGFGFDIAGFSKAMSLRGAYDRAPAVIARLNEQGMTAIPEIAAADMRAYVVAVNDARLTQASKKPLTPVQEQLLQSARRIEQEAMPGTRTHGVRVPPSADVRPPSGQPGSVRIATDKGMQRAPVASQTLFHESGEAVRRLNGDEIELGDAIAQGAYAWVYRLMKNGRATGKVAKVVKQPDFEKDSFDEVFRRMEETDKLYKEFAANNPGTPRLETEFVRWKKDMGIVIQDEVEAMNGYVFRGKSLDDPSIPPEAFPLALDLYRKFAKGKIAWLDAHFKNLYFTKGPDGKLNAAGVLDPDMMVREGEFATNALMAARIIDREFGLHRNIHSVDNNIAVAGLTKANIKHQDRVNAVRKAIERGALPEKMDEMDIAMILEEQAIQSADFAIMQLGKGLKIKLQNAELIMIRHLEAYDYIRFQRSLTDVVNSKGATRGKFVDGLMNVKDVEDAFPNFEKYVNYGDHLIRPMKQSRLWRHFPPVVSPVTERMVRRLDALVELFGPAPLVSPAPLGNM